MLPLKPLIILKLGGSVITYKNISPPKSNIEALSRIADEMKISSNPKIVVLGGGAHGHQAAHKYGYGSLETSNTMRLAGIPEIRHNMSMLALEVESSLTNSGIPSVVLSPFSFVKMNNGIISEFPLEIIQKSIDAGITVILHGDVCFDSVLGSSILSGDTLVVFLAQELTTSSILIGTNVDGIFEENPNDNPEAKIISVIDATNRESVLAGAGPSKSTDVTGGMTRKVNDLFSLENTGIEVVVFNLNIPGRLKRLLTGKPIICTRIQI